MRKRLTGLDFYDEDGQIRDHWLNRADARIVASAIALSESWPRRWLLTACAAMCGVSRAADRVFCALQDHRDDQPISPNALRYLKDRASSEVFDRIMGIHQMMHADSEHHLLRPSDSRLMTVEPLLIDLGAGFRASDAVRGRQHSAAKREARADLAARQRQAIDGK